MRVNPQSPGVFVAAPSAVRGHFRVWRPPRQLDRCDSAAAGVHFFASEAFHRHVIERLERTLPIRGRRPRNCQGRRGRPAPGALPPEARDFEVISRAASFRYRSVSAPPCSVALDAPGPASPAPPGSRLRAPRAVLRGASSAAGLAAANQTPSRPCLQTTAGRDRSMKSIKARPSGAGPRRRPGGAYRPGVPTNLGAGTLRLSRFSFERVLDVALGAVLPSPA